MNEIAQALLVLVIFLAIVEVVDREREAKR